MSHHRVTSLRYDANSCCSLTPLVCGVVWVLCWMADEHLLLLLYFGARPFFLSCTTCAQKKKNSKGFGPSLRPLTFLPKHPPLRGLERLLKALSQPPAAYQLPPPKSCAEANPKPSFLSTVHMRREQELGDLHRSKLIALARE